MVDKIIPLIQGLRRRPSMYFSPGHPEVISTYITFFEGFFLALGLQNDLNMERELSNWYQDKVDIKAPNMVWYALFLLVNKEKEEKEKINLLFDTIEAFFRENSKRLFS